MFSSVYVRCIDVRNYVCVVHYCLCWETREKEIEQKIFASHSIYRVAILNNKRFNNNKITYCWWPWMNTNNNKKSDMFLCHWAAAVRNSHSRFMIIRSVPTFVQTTNISTCHQRLHCSQIIFIILFGYFLVKWAIWNGVASAETDRQVKQSYLWYAVLTTCVKHILIS